MKKILIRAAIVISVLLLIFKVFLMYRDYASYKNVIHKEADKVVKIRVDGIIKSIAYNAIKNPSYYYNNQKTEKDTIDERNKQGKGFGSPANIFLYTIKGKSTSTIFTSFKISHAQDFKEYLKNEHSIYDLYKLKSITVAKNKDEKLLIAYNDKQCVIAYNPSKEAIDGVFLDVLNDHKTLQDDNVLFSKLKDTDAHITFVSYDDEVSINFNDGAIAIAGNIMLPSHIKIPTNTTLPKFSEDSSVKFHLNVISSKKNETTTFKNFSVELDSVYRHYRGNFYLEIAGATTQQDSIVTYEYNDDFEKEETVSLSQKQVPEINIYLSAKPKEMLNYLENESIINNGMLNKELFPLYQFKIDTTATSLQASTNLTKNITSSQLSYPECFALDIDFKKLKQQNHFPILTPFLENLINLKLRGKNTSENALTLQGQVKLKNEHINALSQLLFQQNEK